MRRSLLALVVLAGCTRVGTGQGGDTGESIGEPKRVEPTRIESVPAYAPAPAPTPAPTQTPAPTPPTPPPAPPPVKAQKPKIELASVTLADDCGGAAPSKAATKANVKADMDESADRGARSKAKRRCEQTSMQLNIEVFTTTRISVKSVELFDDTGTSLGRLTASHPRLWSTSSSTYETWNERLARGPASNVTYVLSQPTWDAIGDRWNRTFSVKAVITLDGVDVKLQRDVELRASTSLPPGVKT